MNKRQVLKKTELEVKRRLMGEGTGHDWWHIDRIRNTALAIARKEKADLFIVELGALLHDIADHKFHGGDESVGPRVAGAILKRAGADNETIEKVRHIVENVSYSKGVGIQNPMQSFEGKIVQDADRLDAMGAIGIARAFAYGGFKERPLYDPAERARTFKSPEDYKKSKSASTVHHFYEKLLLLKDTMNTKAGKQLAARRHKFMERYLEEFFSEWTARH